MFEDLIGLDHFQSHRVGESLDGHEINTGPIAFGRGWIGVPFSFDASDSHDLFISDAVIKENEVTLLHRAQIIARREITNPGPGGPAFLHEPGPGVSGWFLLHEPMAHWGSVGCRVSSVEMRS